MFKKSVVILALTSVFILGCNATSSSEQQNSSRSTNEVISVPFEQTHWQLATLSGKKVAIQARQKRINMTFAGSDKGVSGFSGCNRFSGGYSSDDNQLKFLPMMSTRMACHHPENQEMNFLMALDKVVSYQINGNELTLIDSIGNKVMTFTTLERHQ